jgi:hypothetical protein
MAGQSFAVLPVPQNGATIPAAESSAATTSQTPRQADDALVMFLAGHGIMIGQRYYFIPHELPRQANQFEDDVRAQGLPADKLSDAVGRVHDVIEWMSYASGHTSRLAKQFLNEEQDVQTSGQGATSP